MKRFLGPKQAIVIQILADHPEGLAPRDLLPLVGAAHANLQDYLLSLLAKGYVERIPDPSFRSRGLYRIKKERRKGSKVRGNG